MKYYNYLFFFIMLGFMICDFWNVSAQNKTFKFAHVTDTHVGGQTGREDLENTVADINQISDIDFVILSGDITEFGSDDELLLAKQIIDKLNKKWYIIPGNHDAKWSESGCNSFVRIFGSEVFSFERNGYRFIGTACGPNMRMGPGQIPREQICYLDSILMNMKDPSQPIIFVNHYPLDESLANWYVALDLLKKRNLQADLLGHGHANKVYNFEGISGVMGRSNLRASKVVGGYNIVTIANDTMVYAEKNPGLSLMQPWCKIPLFDHQLQKDTTHYKRPDYNLNAKYQNLQIVWRKQFQSDISAGIAVFGQMAVFGNTLGEIVALNIKNGNQEWKFKTQGKIFSTPEISGNKVVCASTDKKIYCLNLKTGTLIWSFETEKSVVASPSIDHGVVFIGASDQKFRAIDLKSGKLIWQFDSVKNFVECKPLIYHNKVFFGSWGNEFYALDKKLGRLVWKRSKYTNRMLSPAAVFPVAAANKVFIVAPDRFMTALDAETGVEIWNSKAYSCRESVGISLDAKLLYVKNMTEGNICAFYSDSINQALAWICKADLGYEIAPSPIVEKNNLVFVPMQSGEICAIDKKLHKIAWKYKISNTLVNNVFPIASRQIIATTMDGIVICLKY